MNITCIIDFSEKCISIINKLSLIKNKTPSQVLDELLITESKNYGLIETRDDP